jgi:hypothetical protein
MGRSGAAQASAYVPLNDIAYKYADALIARGALQNLSLLERPYTALALAVGSIEVLATSQSPVLRSYALALQTAVARYGIGAQWQTNWSEGRLFITGDVFATAQTSGIRDLMAADTLNSVTGGADVRVGFTAGPLVMMLHPVVDNRLNNDPQFGGRKDRAIAARTQDAYVSGQWQYAQLFVGRIDRNWGPYTQPGLELGTSPYSYDQLYAQFGTRGIHLSAVAAKLDDSFQPDGVYARYFYVHRLGIRWKGLEAGINEAYVATGIGRSYDLALMNPLNLYSLSWRNERDDGNLNIGGDVALRTSRYGTYTGELFIDDWQIDTCDSTCDEPASYGVTVSAEGVPLVGEQRLFASYTRLTALAYRTPKPAEEYASFGVGLGRAFSDYDEARVGVDLALIPYATTRLYGAYRRHGEGDYHLPLPPRSSYGTISGFLMGTVERTARVGVEAGWMIAPGVELTGDGGFNRVTNYEHETGVTHSGFEGRVRLQWTPRGFYRAF